MRRLIIGVSSFLGQSVKFIVNLEYINSLLTSLRISLDPTLINGRIVICTLEEILDDRRGKATAIQDGGGVGIILVDPLAKDIGFQFVLPATAFGLEEAEEHLFQPDITVPGVNILAAWSPLATDITAGTSTNYKIASGTSISWPHVSGIAAIVKASQPSWSPAAIKSSFCYSMHKIFLILTAKICPSNPFMQSSSHPTTHRPLDITLVSILIPSLY